MRKADNLPPSCAVVTKSGNLNFLKPSGPFWACNGTAFYIYCLSCFSFHFCSHSLAVHTFSTVRTKHTARSCYMELRMTYIKMLTDQSLSQHCRVWRKVWIKSCAAQCCSTSSKIDRAESMVTDPSYLFNAASLNYAISHSDFTASYIRMTVRKVLKRMWKEAVDPWLRLLCPNFSGETENNHGNGGYFRQHSKWWTSKIQITCCIAWAKLLCH